MEKEKHLSLKTIVNKTIIKNNNDKYWYKTFEDICSFCGNNKSFKKRIYGNKPKSLKNRKEIFFLGDCTCITKN